MSITHLDLFSGIGGFALATEMVWDNVEHTFCDNEPFSQAILQKHWPNSKIYGDIRTLTADSEHARLERSQQKERTRYAGQRDRDWAQQAPHLLTGGFPCQPFSQAGRRKGTEDDRFLWPEMLRVIREFRPRWVVGENVAGLLTIERGVVFEQVFADLEREGYTVQPFVIPAVAVNAPHRRDRVWIVARDTNSNGRTRGNPKINAAKRGKSPQHNAQGRHRTIGADVLTNAQHEPAGNEERKGHDQGPSTRTSRPDWSKNWTEVATRLCRMDDGLPRRMDRAARLKALGNAIVPQVAEEIFKAIKQTDEANGI